MSVEAKESAEAKTPKAEAKPASAPAATVPKKPEPAEAPTSAPRDVAPPAEPQKTPPVPLAIYLTQQKIALDQAAGFAMYAEMHGLRAKTILQWKTLHDTFNKRPV